VLRCKNAWVSHHLNGQDLIRNDLDAKTTEPINEVVTGGDGLVIIDDNTYIASRWKGEIYLIKDGKEYLLLDTTGEGSNTADIDRKSTRLNSSHVKISYAVFCLKRKIT